MKMNRVQELVTYKALDAKRGAHDMLIDAAIVDGDVKEIRNVCAKLHVSLVDRLDQVTGLLDMSKRAFIESAVIDALDQAEQLIDDLEVCDDEGVPRGLIRISMTPETEIPA